MRNIEVPYRVKTGLPALDQLFDVFQDPQITRQHHTQASTAHQSMHQQVSIPRSKPPVLDLTGATPCSGKTQLLYHIVGLSILPQTQNHDPLRGKGEVIVVLDLDSKFSVLRLRETMSSHIRSCLTSPPEDQELSSLLLSSLQHVHIFRPQSSLSLLATVSSLPSYLFNTSNHVSANRAVSAVVISNLSAFLWQDRLDTDEANFVSCATQKGNASTFVQKYRDLVSALRHVQQVFECAIIATNWGLAPVEFDGGNRALRQHLPAVWNNFCTLKLVVERDSVSKFGPGISVEEAYKESRRRQDAVDESPFSCSVNWWESEKWRQELRGVKKGAGFRFFVRNGGLVVDGGEGEEDIKLLYACPGQN